MARIKELNGYAAGDQFTHDGILYRIKYFPNSRSVIGESVTGEKPLVVRIPFKSLKPINKIAPKKTILGKMIEEALRQKGESSEET